MNQTEYVLNRILHFISTEIQHAKPLNPDIPIQNNFDDALFDELDIVLALVKYEIEALVEIPDELLDFRFTLHQLAKAIALMSKIEPDKVEEFRSGKYKMLSDIGEQLRRGLKTIQKGNTAS